MDCMSSEQIIIRDDLHMLWAKYHTNRHCLHQDGEHMLCVRSGFCLFLGNFDMIQIRILIKKFVVYALPAHCHYCHIKAIILLK